jgi:phage FluMu gp28-like protein
VFRRILDAVSLAPPTGRAAVIGVDWGRVNDFTVFAVLSDAGELLELDRFRGIEYALQRARLQALYERHGRPTIIAEANSMGGPVIEQLQRDGLKVKPFMTTNASKAEAIEALALAFERGEIRIPNDPVLLGELAAFEVKPLPSGLMRYDAPSGGHDDTVMALAIAWHGIAGKKRGLDPAFFRSVMDMNAGLAGTSGWRGAGGDADTLASHYPEGGTGGKRWRM